MMTTTATTKTKTKENHDRQAAHSERSAQYHYLDNIALKTARNRLDTSFFPALFFLSGYQCLVLVREEGNHVQGVFPNVLQRR